MESKITLEKGEKQSVTLLWVVVQIVFKYPPKMFVEFMTTDNQKEIYLLNAISLQMIDTDREFHLDGYPINREDLPTGLTSAIGHADTAAVLGVPMNRINVHLNPGDVAYVAQLQGGRLPEGSTTLPDGFSFKFFEVHVR